MTATAPPLRGTNEADVSTKQPTTQTDTRLPRSHGHPGRPAGAETPARQGSQAAHGQHPAEAAVVLTPARRDEQLPKRQRIRKRAEFLRLQRVGRRKSGPRFVVITEPRRNGITRLGITTSRQVGGAVVRNRVRRLVREFFRRQKYQIVLPQDVLVIAKASAANASFAEVVQELAEVLKLHVEH
jgi:ribonuclease P protein component